MTLAELADYVTAKVGQTDTQSVQICKTFLNARYRMIWDTALWKDTQIMVTVDVDPVDTTQVFMPREMERVMKIRNTVSSTTLLFGGTIGTLMDYDPTLFDQSGLESTFIHLPSLAQPYLFDHATFTFTPNVGTSGDVNAFVGAQVYIKGPLLVSGGQIVGETVTLGQTGVPVSTQNDYAEVYSLSKPVTDGIVSVQAGAVNFAGMYPDETSAPQYARVKLLPGPTDTTGRYLCYGKRRVLPLVDDGDSPLITGIDNALLAFAQADMLQRQRQYAKSQALLQEATGQMQELLDLERNQMAYLQRVIPAPVNTNLYYDDFYGNLGKGYW